MASTAASSSTTLMTTEKGERPQAGPLPVKRGEIGFIEDVHGHLSQQADAQVELEAPLPERHPADRNRTDDVTTHSPPSSSSPSDVGNFTVAGTSSPSPAPDTDANAATTAVTDSSSVHSMRKNKLIAFLNPKNVPSYSGLRLTTLMNFFGLILLFGGTVAGWAITAMHLSHRASQQKSSSDPTSSTTTMNTSMSSIFLHVVFGFVTLCELVFIERKIFRLRAERYSHLHPGEMLPSYRRRYEPEDGNMPLAPWLRPPLPTYAAALAQSGHGTGDVEDHVIAQAPPPAYGNTRGSTLLLSGFLRESLRSNRRLSGGSSRSVSYASTDERWEEVRDAERARRLEDGLDSLERPAQAAVRR